MEDVATDSAKGTALPVILIGSVVQGWALFALHHSVKYEHWPATDPAWFFALLSSVTVATLSAQVLAAYMDARVTRLALIALSAAYFYFGWHQGSAVVGDVLGEGVRFEACIPYGMVAAILWLLVMPLLHGRILSGGWSYPYAYLFDSAWRNKLTIAEALLFTGLFWVLLGIWQELLHLLGFDFFRDLFGEPIFIYPVTALVFGIALHLIGSVGRLTTLLLGQLLNVLKWLAPLAALIMALFTAALVPKLPGMWSSDQRIIGATWLLWLSAFIVLFWNAAYRDGTVDAPFPQPVASILRYVTPLLLLVTGTALYAIVVRGRAYGFTVDRVWALIIASTALMYSVGYSIAAMRSRGWLTGLAQANVTVALGLVLTLCATLTPILSPYRLAAASQFAQALRPPRQENREPERYYGWIRGSPFHYLRWDAGEYGRRRLQALARLPESAQFARIRRFAEAELASKSEWLQPPTADAAEMLNAIRVFPPGRSLDATLRTFLLNHIKEQRFAFEVNDTAPRGAGLFVDLDGDGQDEFVLFSRSETAVFRFRHRWELLDQVPSAIRSACELGEIITDLDQGRYSTQPPQWKSLSVGQLQVHVQDSGISWQDVCTPGKRASAGTLPQH